MKIALAVFLIFISLIIYPSDAEMQDDIQTGMPVVDLYVPEYMIVGSEYLAMVTYQNHGNGTLVGTIITNSDALLVQNSTSIPPYADHAIFGITPTHAGVFNVSVRVEGITLERSVTISDGMDTDSLLLLVPEYTGTERILGAVYLVDSAGSPVVAEKNVTVSLRGSPGITVPESVVISEASTGATFEVRAGSSGSISASSGAMYDTANVTVESQRLHLAMDVYPEIMHENSFGYYILWFEDEDGNPRIPGQITTAAIHSSESDVARMHVKITADATSQTTNTFSDGVTYGRIFTGTPGPASVTASVPGYGSVTSEFVVGPAAIGISEIANATASVGNMTDLVRIVDAPSPLERDGFVEANEILFDVIPPRTVYGGYIVAGLYHTVGRESVDIGEDGIAIFKETAAVYPILADRRAVYITSDGADHEDSAILDTFEIPTHANLYEVAGTPGRYNIDVSSPQVRSSSSEEFLITGDSQMYGIRTVALPSIPGHIQDLAMVYIADSGGMVVDPKEAFGRGVTIHLASDSVSLSSSFVDLNDPVGIIGGAYVDGGPQEIVTHADSLGRTAHRVGADTAGIIGDVIIEVPRLVHSHEPFAASAHLIDHMQVISDLTGMIEASGGCRSEGGAIFHCTRQGTLSVFSETGSQQVLISPYSTDLAVTIEYSFDGEMSVGKRYIVSVAAPEGSQISADTAIPSEVDGNTIVLSPAMAGKFEVTVIVSRPGMKSHTESVYVTVDDSVNVAVAAQDQNGMALGVDVTLLGAINHSEMTDYTVEVPRSSVTVQYPQSARHGDSGYRLVGISVDDGTDAVVYETDAVTFAPDHGYSVLAHYERVILVDVIGGSGGGLYSAGDTVTVSAPERYVLAFLVREVVESWQGIDATSDTVRFVATKDLTLTPIYRTDYAGAAAVFGVMAVLLTAVSFRTDQPYRLRVLQGVDFIWNAVLRLAVIVRLGSGSKNHDGRDSQKNTQSKAGSRTMHILLLAVFISCISFASDSVYADHDRPCSISVRPLLFPVTYDSQKRSNPDSTVYPGDGFHYIFYFSASETCLDVGPKGLKSGGSLGVVSHDIIAGNSADSEIYQNHGSAKLAAKYLKTDNYHKVQYEKCQKVSSGRICQDKSVSEEPFLSIREDSEMTPSQKRTVFVCTGQRSSMTCSSLRDNVTNRPAYAWGITLAGTAHSHDADRHPLEDESSRASFDGTFDRRCDGLDKPATCGMPGILDSKCGSQKPNSGCIFGHVEVDVDFQDMVCLKARVDRHGISYNGVMLDKLGEAYDLDPDRVRMIYYNQGLDTLGLEYYKDVGDFCRQTDHFVSVIVTGHALVCSHGEDRSCSTVKRQRTGSMAVVVRTPVPVVTFENPPIRDLDGYDSKNLDSTYYTWDVPAIHVKPELPFREVRNGTISFEVQRTATPIPEVFAKSCTDGVCTITVSGRYVTDTAVAATNGDRLEAFRAESLGERGLHLFPYLTTTYNIGRSIGVTSQQTSLFIADYAPVFSGEHLPYVILKSPGEITFEKQHGVALHYLGGNGTGPGDDGMVHPDRRAKINDSHHVTVASTLHTQYMLNSTLLMRGGSDIAEIANSAYPSVLETSGIAEYTGYAESLLSINDTAVFQREGFGRMAFSFDDISEIQRFGIANITTYNTIGSLQFGGYDVKYLYSYPYRYPGSHLSSVLNVTAINSNGTTDESVKISVILEADIAHTNRTVHLSEYFTSYVHGRQLPVQFAHMYLGDMHDVSNAASGIGSVVFPINLPAVHVDSDLWGLLGVSHDTVASLGEEFAYSSPVSYKLHITADNASNTIPYYPYGFSSPINYTINTDDGNSLEYIRYLSTVYVRSPEGFGSMEEISVDGIKYGDACTRQCFLQVEGNSTIHARNIWGGTASLEIREQKWNGTGEQYEVVMAYVDAVGPAVIMVLVVFTVVFLYVTFARR